MAVTSESTAFANLGYKTEAYIGPGEIVRLRAGGYEQLRKPNPRKQVCSFLWVYYGFPTSCYEGRNVEETRFNCGKAMGEKDTVCADCACGVPDSGIGMAVGYAAGRGIPYMRTVAKYTPTWARSFMPSNQATRNLVAKMKLIPNRDMLEGKKVLMCDDSIVRGTQLSNNAQSLRELGAAEVHMRIACPPLVYACPFVNFSASKNYLELITRRIIKEWDDEEHLAEYATTGTPQYERMVEEHRHPAGGHLPPLLQRIFRLYPRRGESLITDFQQIPEFFDQGNEITDGNAYAVADGQEVAPAVGIGQEVSHRLDLVERVPPGDGGIQSAGTQLRFAGDRHPVHPVVFQYGHHLF